MERESVISSNVLSIGYDNDIETLEAEFNNGIYQYYNVPCPIYEQLMTAESKGKFLSAYVKPAYPCAKV